MPRPRGKAGSAGKVTKKARRRRAQDTSDITAHIDKLHADCTAATLQYNLHEQRHRQHKRQQDVLQRELDGLVDTLSVTK